MGSFRKKLGTASVFGALLAAALPSHAASITTTDATNPGTYAGFQSIDWADSGSAYITDFGLSAAATASGCIAANNCDTIGGTGLIDPSVDLLYFARATSLGASGPMFFVNDSVNRGSPGSPVRPSGHEYTIVANVNEAARCANGDCSIVSFFLNSGSFNIYYDITPEADPLTGAGFLDGPIIIGGTFASGPAGSFTAIGGPAPAGGGTGSNTLSGTVTLTNPSYINPDLIGTTAGTELKFGPSFTTAGWSRPSGTPSGAIGPDTPSAFMLQADGNQSFSVPEPGTLALLGASLFGIGAIRRRSK